MQKRYLYFALFGICIVLVVFVAIFFQNSSVTPSSTNTPPRMVNKTINQQSAFTPDTTSVSQQGVSPSVLVMNPTSSTIASIVKNFYTWYFTYPGNPLVSGAYKNSPYLSDTFKQNTAALFDPSQPSVDPIFCNGNKTNSVSFGNVYYIDENNATVTVTRHTDKKDLYRFAVKKENGRWVINDIVCIP